VRRIRKKPELSPNCLQWRETETDEFTRRAIDGALVEWTTALRETILCRRLPPKRAGEVYRMSPIGFAIAYATPMLPSGG